MKAGLRGPLLLYELLYELCMSCRRVVPAFLCSEANSIRCIPPAAATGSGISVYIVTRYYAT